MVAWLLTLPAAAVVGALTWYVGHLLGGVTGAVAVVALLVALAATVWQRSRRDPVGSGNVNEEWAAEVREPATAR